MWYSDSEVQGNYKDDIPRLIQDAECAVLLIDPDFTRGFLSDNRTVDCITAREVTAIAGKLLNDSDFQIVTVYLDRLSAFQLEEGAILSTLFRNEGVERPEEAARLICQSNAVFFSTATDDENDLFYRLSRKCCQASITGTILPGVIFLLARCPPAQISCCGTVKTG